MSGSRNVLSAEWTLIVAAALSLLWGLLVAW